MDRDLILLTGASGYVGGRLRHSLEAAGRPLRCMARRPAELRARVAESTDVVAGDVLDPATLPAALRGVHTAYYLIHGETGWYHGRRLWWIRGQLDRLAGGPGLRRGRRDPTSVFVGDPLDFWRVEQFEPGRRLRLAAEMRLPGRAWLQFEVTPDRGGSLIRQTAEFDPVGVAGLLYWYALWPVHQLVFAGMLRNIASNVV